MEPVVARSGRFGRQPRQTPSLTSALVAIAREYQNQRAQNIMDAWQKGGTFEGKKATDAVVLAFWKDKMGGVSKDDPLYDTYQNAHTQLDYTIHESKMTAAYALSPKGDGDNARMVAFYLGWAKRVPKDSEFYRVLQRDAGQYMRRAQSDNRAEVARRKEEAYQRAQAGTQKQMEGSGEYIIDIFRRIAQSGNVAQGIAPTIGAPGSGSDLTDFDPNDPGVMMRLIAAIAPRENPGAETKKKIGPDGKVIVGDPGEFVGNPDVLYYDDDKRPVTGVDVLKQIAKLDPHFDPGAPFDINYVTTMLDKQMQGLNERITRAKQTGHMTDVASLTKSKQYVALLNREVAAYPIQKAYMEARADYYAVVADRSNSPKAVTKAWDEYAATLTGLAKDPRIQADDNLRARLAAEVNGDAGVPTLYESFSGLSTAAYDASSAKDAVENKVNLDYMRAQVEAVQGEKAMWAYGERDSNGIFHPKAGGRELGAATPDSIAAGGMNPQVITVKDAYGGVPLQVAVTAVPVYATAKDPQTGEPLAASNGQPIAWAFDIPQGTGTVTQYGFQTKTGFVFSADPNFDDRIKPVASAKGGNHLEIDLTAEVARSMGYGEPDPITGQYAVLPKLDQNIDLPNGIHVREAGTYTDTGELKPGIIVFDPQGLAWSTDTRNGLGSTDPVTDFPSLTLSTLMSDEEGRNILLNLDQNPAFKTQLDNDAYAASGYTKDLKTGTWVPGANADPAKLDAALKQQGLATSQKNLVDFISESFKGIQRLTTGSPYPGSTNQTGQTGPDFTIEGFKKLATDLVQGTPFESLGKVFMPGTSNIKPPESPDDPRFAIKPANVIKTPTLPPVKPVTTTSTGPMGGPTAAQPVQTGSQAPGGTTSQQGQSGSQAPTPPRGNRPIPL